jgi:hypothetical protein
LIERPGGGRQAGVRRVVLLLLLLLLWLLGVGVQRRMGVRLRLAVVRLRATSLVAVRVRRLGLDVLVVLVLGLVLLVGGGLLLLLQLLLEASSCCIRIRPRCTRARPRSSSRRRLVCRLVVSWARHRRLVWRRRRSCLLTCRPRVRRSRTGVEPDGRPVQRRRARTEPSAKGYWTRGQASGTLCSSSSGWVDVRGQADCLRAPRPGRRLVERRRCCCRRRRCLQGWAN